MTTVEEFLILKAAADGDLQLLKEAAASDEEGFLEKCERIRNCEGLTVLHCAAEAGKTQICKFLIENVKMNINIKTKEGETPLFVAMKADHLPTATYFIQHGADVNESDPEGESPLHYAALEGNEKLMQLLISQGAEIEALYNHGTPLQAATSLGKKEAVRILLEHKANPNSVSSLSITPVMLSIATHSIECLDMLLKAGADPNISSGGMTPLARAASEVETQYMKLLLGAGANPDVVNPTGMTAIEHAAMAHNHATVMILFPVTSRIPSISDWSCNGIMSYVHSNKGKKQRELKRKENFLLAKKRGEAAVKRKDYQDAVCCYTEANYLYPNDATVLSNRSLCWVNLNKGSWALRDAETCVQLRPDWPKAHYREGVAWKLLKKYYMASEAFSVALRLDPENKEIRKEFKEAIEAEFDLLILKAAADGNLQLLKQAAANDGEGFLEKCERISNCAGLTALHCAAAAGETQICKFLIENVKMNINKKAEKGETPLFLAMKVDHLPTVTYFIQHGADVNGSSFKGKTPLHYAAEQGHKKLMQFLISQGADIEAICIRETPLQVATSHGKKEAVRILLEHNANPNSASPISFPPVIRSVIAHSIECLDMLLKAGADPNISSCGMTPLALAASKVETQYVEFLLRAGANPDVVDPTGMTPIEHAALACNHAAVMILFPVTSRIPSIPDWSFHGIMSYVHSNEGKEQREMRRKENFLSAKKRGEAAVKRKDYLDAVCCYTEANYLDPNDAAVLSNRSLCWANLNEGSCALRDAGICVQLRPDWPKAHYREGVAWKLLEDYSMASESFSVALRLDPENKEIHKAFKEAVEAEFGMSVADNIKAFDISA